MKLLLWFADLRNAFRLGLLLAILYSIFAYAIINYFAGKYDELSELRYETWKSEFDAHNQRFEEALGTDSATAVIEEDYTQESDRIAKEAEKISPEVVTERYRNLGLVFLGLYAAAYLITSMTIRRSGETDE